MNSRRSFIQSIIKAGLSATILPTATTYARHWIKQNDIYITNPAWITAPYEIAFYFDNLTMKATPIRMDIHRLIIPQYIKA